MFNIKWIGMIKEIEIKKYQRGELSRNAEKMKMPKSSNEQMIKALPFLIPAIIVMFFVMFIKTYIAKAIVALASYPLAKKRFILMCLLPYILGIIPLICFVVSPSSNLILNAILWGMSFLGMVSPYPDAYNVYQIVKQVPKGKKIQFYEDDKYYI